MAATWTTEQVLRLAPDDASAKSGRSLATVRKWVSLGSNANMVWGEYQGSAQAPYQTGIGLEEPAFHCTCPSRKVPCKHSLGLFLLYAEHGDSFAHPTPPGWITEWLVARGERAARHNKPAHSTAPDTTARARKNTGQKQRTAQRADRVTSGIKEVELWLRDLVRQGLAVAQSQPPRYWEAIAARMVDAQAPGIARWLREMSSLPASGEGWTERLLERIGLLHLLLESYKRIDQLPAPIQADVRAAFGFTLKQEDVLSQQQGVRDTWLVLGQRTFEEERLRVQRTWLHGARSGRAALLLEFAYGNQVLDTDIMPGMQFDAELAFYPGNYPLRAAVKGRFSTFTPLTRLPAFANAEQALAAYAAALGQNAWLESFPMGIEDVIPLRGNGNWYARDANAQRIPLAPSFGSGWSLMALSGGQALTLFGEWDGRGLYPLSAWAEDRFAKL